jgi:small-conductance mechanosensitive channel
MEKILEALNVPLTTLAGQPVTLARIFTIIAILAAGYYSVRWVERAMLKRLAARNTNPDLVHLIRRIFFVVVIAIFAVTTLELLNVPLSAFAFISGAVAIGIGFGAQNIINNFISGWILMWERPIRIGDYLEIGEIRGTVEAINTRSTRIKRVDGVHILIPNSHLLENMVVNWTLIDRLARTQVRVGVAYGSPVRKVEEILYKAVAADEQILQQPKPMVIFDSFADNSLEFEVLFWVLADGDKDLRVIRSDVRFRIDEMFRAEGITIAFPQRDIHIDSLAPIAVRVVDQGDERNG